MDKLRGREREVALESALGLAPSDRIAQARETGSSLPDDVIAMRELTEAVEAAVRGKEPNALGLDWSGDF